MPFAIYAGHETQVRYFNGVGYVARHEMFPRTRYVRPDSWSQVTRQGHAVYVGARRGDDLTVRRYTRPDTGPFYIPEGYRD